MIAVDTNILVYAHRGESPFFVQAQSCLRDLAQGRAPWALPWPCLHEFYAIVTHPRRYDPPSTPRQAINQIGEWINSPWLRLIAETPSHWDVLGELIVSARIKGALVHDARVAAICLQHGVREFWTADRDFNWFPKLNCRNPLIA